MNLDLISRSGRALIGLGRGFASFISRSDRETLRYDVLIVGAGPSGLCAAIRIKQLCKEKDKNLSVCVIDKGSDVGSHILSGNVLETRALDELLPDWKTRPDVPIKVAATSDAFYYLPSGSLALRLPIPPRAPLRNKGNYVVSLSEVCRWLGKEAEAAGVDVLAGYAGSEMLYDWSGAVVGVATGDSGIGRDGKRIEGRYSAGVELRAKATLLAEGCRGSLSEAVMTRFRLRDAAEPQTYALGLKEVWEVPPEIHKPGTVIHTMGYPLGHSEYGGGFIYHMDNNKVALGLVIGLDYTNPSLNTHKEFQRWKMHRTVRKHIEGGTCLQYGARMLNEGGYQSIPKLTFPGGALIGCSAGFLNVPKIKGTHTAMMSGMLAGQAAFRALTGEETTTGVASNSIKDAVPSAPSLADAGNVTKHAGGEGEPGPAIVTPPVVTPAVTVAPVSSEASTTLGTLSADALTGTTALEQQVTTPSGPCDLSSYETALDRSWIKDELNLVRNIRPGFKWGLLPGLLHSLIDTYIFRGKAPWTLTNGRPDHERLRPARDCPTLEYPDKPDGKISFDLPRSLYLSGTNHDHDQPSHLMLRDIKLPERLNEPHFGGPETKYCPAGVFEYVEDEVSGRRRLSMNAQNCLHCKACDIKDPQQNIKWTVPQGGGGPGYKIM